MKSLREIVRDLIEALFVRRVPTTEHKLVAIHIAGAAPRSALH